MDQVVALAASAETEPPRWQRHPTFDREGVDAFTPSRPPRHVHLLWSLTLGGAERIVADLARSFAEHGAEADIVVLRDAPCEHAVAASGIVLHRVGHLQWAERRAYAAGVILASRLPAYCHLLSPEDLAPLWRLGCRTVPVVHNVREGWKSDPTQFNCVQNVPFVVACGEAAARDLIDAGLRKPIRVLRHVVPAPPPMAPSQRRRLRAAFGAPTEGDVGAKLLGMVGRFVPQKDYPQAVWVLAELRRRGRDVRLVILGGASDATGAACRHEVDHVARRLGVRDRLVMPGPIVGAGALVSVFDLLLNTSRFEGVSIATMDAVASGVRVVGADVGGQAEAICPCDRLVPAGASLAVWADAIEASLAAPAVSPPPRDRRACAAAARVWPWMLALGPGAPPPRRRTDLLFVTGNLDVGGAQRSLCNLAAALAPRGMSVTVAVCGPIGVPAFTVAARAAGASFIDLSEQAAPTGGLHGRAGRVLALALSLGPRALAFWNMDAATKLMVVKALAGGPIRVADVSPGPMLFHELDAEEEFGRSLSFTPDQYLASLDLLVVKYRDGVPPPGRARPARVAVIPNGVPDDPVALAPQEGPHPPLGADPSLAAVTVGRLVATKRPDLLAPVARALATLLPGATLTVVGGLHGDGSPRGPAWSDLLATSGETLPLNLHFAGPDHRTRGFLGRFACFYMVSSGQGCPNASLEAMQAGLPIVANPDGGTAEQVVHGVTGLLVPDQSDPIAHAAALASALALVLRDPAGGRRMGAAGRLRAKQHFSIAEMVDSYARVFGEL
jgi:glycosyltransferase involved in cell wall biosynthesis